MAEPGGAREKVFRPIQRDAFDVELCAGIPLQATSMASAPRAGLPADAHLVAGVAAHHGMYQARPIVRLSHARIGQM
jgi:hypothetical protein